MYTRVGNVFSDTFYLYVAGKFFENIPACIKEIANFHASSVRVIVSAESKDYKIPMVFAEIPNTVQDSLRQ